MTPKIRPVTKEDKPAIVRILKNTPEFTPAEVVVAKEVLDSYLHNPEGSGYHILVAEVDSAVSGYICYGPTPLTEGTWDVYWIAVSPDSQGRGIGRALITCAESKMREASARMIILETSSQPSYEKTHRFYYSLGYQLIARIPDFYTAGDDLLILQKRLK